MQMETDHLERSGFAHCAYERLSSAGQADVYRIWPVKDDTTSVIVKLTDRVSSVQREQVLSDWLQRFPVVPSPRVLSTGADQELAWVIYEDTQLQAVSWTVANDGKIARLIAALHRTADRESKVWTEGSSHTPAASAIWQEVVTTPWLEVANYLQATGIASGPLTTAQMLHRLLCDTEPVWQAWPLVGSHGDMHRGNVLTRSDAAAFSVIDWEYAHVDAPFFDLFQWLDATSPTQPLRRLMTRAEGIASYCAFRYAEWDRESVAMRRETRHFLLAYLQYAAAHLFWIVLRVGRDAASGRFAPRQLRLQQWENARGLHGISRTLRSLGMDGNSAVLYHSLYGKMGR